MIYTTEEDRLDCVYPHVDYIDSDGNIKEHSKVKDIIIRDENDLDLLTNYSVGSKAYTPDMSKSYVKNAGSEWVEVSSSGGTGGGAFYIDCTYTPADGEGESSTWTDPTKTFAETVAAYEEGSVIFIRFTNGPFVYIVPCMGLLMSDETISAIGFYDAGMPLTLMYMSDGTISGE